MGLSSSAFFQGVYKAARRSKLQKTINNLDNEISGLNKQRDASLTKKYVINAKIPENVQVKELSARLKSEGKTPVFLNDELNKLTQA